MIVVVACAGVISKQQAACGLAELLGMPGLLGPAQHLQVV